MKLILMFIALLSLATVSIVSADGEVWNPPNDCADEDRVIPGNRTSACQWVAPILNNVEYRVDMQYPYCAEKFIFDFDGAGTLPNGQSVRTMQLVTGTSWKGDSWNLQRTFVGFERDLSEPMHGSGFYNGDYHVIKRFYGLGDSIPSHFPNGPQSGDPVFAYIRVWGAGLTTNTIPFPAFGGRSDSINACLTQIQQEKTLRAMQAQATIAARELEALKASQQQIAATELLKTQALAVELAHAEARTVILQDIIRIRLAGTADRTRLLNEHLERIRESSADFDVETSEVETTIQEYIDFNAALLTEINQYYENLRIRLETTEQSIIEQEAALKAMEAEGAEIAIPTLEATPES